MKIIWSNFAIQSLKHIYDYYAENANKKVATKIKNQILNRTKQLKKYPESGQIEIYLKKLGLKHRYLVCGNYKIIYRVKDDEIIINDVFDTRQHPDKMIQENR